MIREHHDKPLGKKNMEIIFQPVDFGDIGAPYSNLRSACTGDQSLPIRLVTCSSSSNDEVYRLSWCMPLKKKRRTNAWSLMYEQYL